MPSSPKKSRNDTLKTEKPLKRIGSEGLSVFLLADAIAAILNLADAGKLS